MEIKSYSPAWGSRLDIPLSKHLQKAQLGPCPAAPFCVSHAGLHPWKTWEEKRGNQNREEIDNFVKNRALLLSGSALFCFIAPTARTCQGEMTGDKPMTMIGQNERRNCDHFCETILRSPVGFVLSTSHAVLHAGK